MKILVSAFLGFSLFAAQVDARECSDLFSTTVATVATESATKIEAVPKFASHVSAGYRLNDYILKRATEEPTTKNSTRQMVELIRFVETVSPEVLVELSNVVKDDWRLFAALKIHSTAMFPGQPLATSTIGILMDAVKKANAERLAQSSVVDIPEQVRLVRHYLKSLAVSHRLPDLRDVLNTHPELFKVMAGALHLSVVDSLAGSRALPNMPVHIKFTAHPQNMTISDHRMHDAYVRTLSSAIDRIPNSTFEQKMATAVATADRLVRSTLGPVFTGVFVEQSQIFASLSQRAVMAKKTSVREAIWQQAGISLLEALYQNLLRFQAGRSIDDSETVPVPEPEQAVKYLGTLIPMSAPEFNLIYESLRRCYTRACELNPDPNGIRAAMRLSLLPRGEAIRHAVKEMDQERQRLAKLQKQTQPLPVYPTMKLKNSGVRVAVVQGQLLKKSVANAEAQVSVAAPAVVAVSLPADVKPLTNLLLGRPEAGIRYAFRFPNTHEDNYVQIDEAVMVELRRKNQTLGSWVSDFLLGLASHQGASGVKQIQSARGDVWEIKSTAMGFRVLVQQDKDTKLWRWLALVPHDRIDHYIRAHRL